MANTCLSSQYNIHVKPNACAYENYVEIIYVPAASNQRRRKLTKGNENIKKCHDILKLLHPLRGRIYAYFESCLLTSTPLNDDVVDLRIENDSFLRRSLGGGYITVTIKRVRRIYLADFSSYIRNFDIRKALEIILSHDALESGKFEATGFGFFCESDEIRFTNEYSLRNGNYKGVNIVESPHGPQAVLVLSNSKKIFYSASRGGPCQHIPKYKLSAYLQNELLLMNCLTPNERYEAIGKQFKLLNMNNRVTREFGIEIENDMTEGKFSRLEKVQIIAANNRRLVSDDYGKFNFGNNKYLNGAQIDQLLVISPDPEAAKPMIQEIVKLWRQKGGRISETRYVQQQNFENMSDFEMLKGYRNRKTIAVYVTDSKNDFHALLKFAETTWSIPTQHITPAKAANFKYAFVETLTQQLNVKGGGSNHKVNFKKLDLSRGNVLVIALDVCHDTSGDKNKKAYALSVVGICANCFEEDSLVFSGNVFVQESHNGKPREDIDPQQLHQHVFQLLEKSANRYIDTVVVLRDGISESQYNTVIPTEMDAIKQACNDFFKHAKTKFLNILVTKRGLVRHFFVPNNRFKQSLPPRSIVTFGCRREYNEFYCIPHQAPKGTAKAGLYTIFENDLNLKNQEIQEFILELTSLHPISNKPISIPHPIYLSDKLALKGMNNYQILKKIYPSKIPRYPNGQIKYLELSNLISYNGGNLPVYNHSYVA